MTTKTDKIAFIKQRLDIVEVARGINGGLRSVGDGKYKGLCPFPSHTDTKPSFQVNEKEQRFFCHGCRKSGDVLDLYQELHGVTQSEAIHTLLNELGYKEGPKDPLTREEINLIREREAFKRAHQVYLNNFQEGSDAYQYMISRGFTSGTFQRFAVGSSANSLEALIDAVTSTGLGIEDGVSLGIICKSQKGSNLYDPMAGRVVFPIYKRSYVVGFSGRVVPPSQKYAKYYNTEFTKGETLFGLRQAEAHIRKLGYAILSEGYTDVLAMNQSGFGNCVAPMGIAITPEQLDLLAEHCHNLMLLLDGDKAGHAAVFRNLGLVLQRGFTVKVALLQDDQDPDSLLMKGEEGKTAMRGYLAQAKSGLELWLSHKRSESMEAMTEWIEQFVRSRPTPWLQSAWSREIGKIMEMRTSEVLYACGIRFGKDTDAQSDLEVHKLELEEKPSCSSSIH